MPFSCLILSCQYTDRSRYTRPQHVKLSVVVTVGGGFYYSHARCALQSSSSHCSPLMSLKAGVFVKESILPLFAQAIMYGLYVGTFVHCLRWLLFDDNDWNIRKKINWSMLTIGIILFSLMTINLWIALRLAIGPALQARVLVYAQSWLVPVEVRWSPDKTCSPLQAWPTHLHVCRT